MNDKIKKRSLGPGVVLVALAVTGCEVGPTYEPPRVTVLSEYGEQGLEPTTRPDAATGNGAPASKTLSGQPPVIAWWTTFHDPVLDTLIVRAVDANLDLRTAESHVREARAQRESVGSGLFPTVDVNGSYQHVRPSENGIASAFGGGGPSGTSSSGPNSSGSTGGSSGGGVNVGGSGSHAPGAGGSSAIPGASLGELDLYQLGFDSSWELDFFGRVRRSVEGADASVQAAVEARRDVLLTLLGEVARNYAELRTGQQRLQIARQNLAAQRQTLKLVDELVSQGLTTQFDLSRARAEVATTEAQLPPLQVQVSQSIHRISVLLAQRPTALAEELSVTRATPGVPDEVPIGLPSDLLRRRPDIRRAERQLAAATAGEGVATADLFPRFSLVGSLGLQSIEPGNFFDFASRYFSIGPSISYPLFDAGKTRTRLHVAQAQREQATYAFQQTVLVALRDVEDALIAFQKEQTRTRSLQAAVDANQQSLRIAQDLYRQGLQDFLAVLDAQRSLFAADDALAQSKGLQATSLIALYKSLGGGWELREYRDLYGSDTPRSIVAKSGDVPDGLVISSSRR